MTSTTNIPPYDPTAPCCAYCYRIPTSQKLQKCSQCHSRLYCSRDCQRNDWRYGGLIKGGGHKFWCTKAGEKGVDFAVQHIEGKGLGLVALRNFQRGDKILVERPVLRAPHEASAEELRALENQFDTPYSVSEAVLALGPANGSLQDKFLNNRMKLSTKASGLFVTLARANHACIGNSGHFHDAQHGVEVLVATRDISEGDEITFPYAARSTADERATILQQEYGFACHCEVCQNPDLAASLDQVLELDEQIGKLVRAKQLEEALETANALLELHETVHSADTYRARTHFDLFQLQVSHEETLSTAMQHIQKAHQHALRFFGLQEHPLVRQYKYYWDHPEKHPDYLRHNSKEKKLKVPKQTE